MNCQNFESVVYDLARQQMMEANLRDSALLHTDECELCAVRLAEERALTQVLHAVASEMTGVEAPGRVEAELLAAFRGNKSIQPKRSANYNGRYWATAAAAVLLIVVGIAAMSMRSRWSPVATGNPSVTPSQANTAGNTNGMAKPSVSIDERAPAGLSAQGTISTSRNPKRNANSLSTRLSSVDNRSKRNVLAVDSDSTVAANYGRNEIATDFMPVAYASPMNLEDGGQVMRVELPRSSLAGFGLPVNMELVNERVKADVLVGPDGQARAIRFVR